jgi:hypothetical protein
MGLILHLDAVSKQHDQQLVFELEVLRRKQRSYNFIIKFIKQRLNVKLL